MRASFLLLSLLVFTPGFAFAGATRSVQVAPPAGSQGVSISDPAVKADYEKALRLLNGKSSPDTTVERTADSTGTRGGGDNAKAQKKSLTEWMRSGQLNSIVADYAQRIDASKAISSDTAAIWNLMMSNGLLDDIKNSKYVPSESCPTGADPNSSASAVIGGRALQQTDVCFDIEQIVNNRTSLASVVALALHEHTHHYGFGEASAYFVTEMVGSQIDSMEISHSQPVADQVNPSPGDQRLASTVKKGSKIKLLQNLDRVNGPYFQNGRVYSGFGDITLGVDCFLEGYLIPGKTYHMLAPFSGTSDMRTPLVTAPDVTFPIEDAPAQIHCERHPDTGSQITITEIHDALDGIFEMNLKL